jgi:hypothetical protein
VDLAWHFAGATHTIGSVNSWPCLIKSRPWPDLGRKRGEREGGKEHEEQLVAEQARVG